MNHVPSENPTAVLVVEDEPMVRALAVDILEEAGFDVIEAATADYAVTVLDKRSDIRVVFTDIHMPGKLNGLELARLIDDHFHQIRVIIGSGKARPGPDEISPRALFIPKPYSTAALVAAVQGMAAASGRNAFQ